MSATSIIKGNLVVLSEKLTNNQKVLLHLVEKDIITLQEMDSIKMKTPFDGNSEIFFALIKKDVDSMTLKSIFQSTGNGHLVQIIEPIESPESEPSMPEDGTLVGSHSLRLSDFDNFALLGSGVFGSVVKAKLKKNDIHYAIKITRDNTYREINCLLRSEHQNIVRFENAWKEKITEELGELHYQFQDYIGLTIYCIQMELCNGRDLSAWILKPYEQKTREDAKQICFQISLGVQSLHSKNIIHRDLKPANILLLNSYRKGSNNIVVKIGDLGMSKQSSKESRASRRSLMTNCGTERYRSPEQETEGDYGVSTDIFSMGIIFVEILYSTVERKEIPAEDTRRGSLPNEFNFSFLSEGELIKAMLSHNPDDRPNSASVANQLNSLWYPKADTRLPIVENELHQKDNEDTTLRLQELNLFPSTRQISQKIVDLYSDFALYIEYDASDFIAYCGVSFKIDGDKRDPPVYLRGVGFAGRPSKPTENNTMKIGIGQHDSYQPYGPFLCKIETSFTVEAKRAKMVDLNQSVKIAPNKDYRVYIWPTVGGVAMWDNPKKEVVLYNETDGLTKPIKLTFNNAHYVYSLKFSLSE